MAGNAQRFSTGDCYSVRHFAGRRILSATISSFFIIFKLFKLLGLRTEAEVKTNQGRIDAVIELDSQIFLFEFKLDGSAEEALQQIHTTEYAEKYRLNQKPITLIGANFDQSERKVSDWVSE
ncbi:MAG: PD-(D/E)XK nuclease domain-containing protein [Chloroflexota bacterium]